MSKRTYDLGEEASWDGLDPEEVRLHHRRLTEEKQPAFPIIDTCRRDNGGILPLDELLYLTDAATNVLHNFIALVPAAGAASRFLRPFDKLAKLIKEGDYKAVRAALRRLKKAEMLRLPLFYSIRELIKSGGDVDDATLDEERSSSLGLFPFPKSFPPLCARGLLVLRLQDCRTSCHRQARKAGVYYPRTQRAFVQEQSFSTLCLRRYHVS